MHHHWISCRAHTHTCTHASHNKTTKWSARYIEFIRHLYPIYTTHPSLARTSHSEKKSSLCQFVIYLHLHRSMLALNFTLFYVRETEYPPDESIGNETKIPILHTLAHCSLIRIDYKIECDGGRQKFNFFHFFLFLFCVLLNCKCVKTGSSHHVHLPFTERRSRRGKKTLRRITVGGCVRCVWWGGREQESFSFKVFAIFHFPRISTMAAESNVSNWCGEQSRPSHHSIENSFGALVLYDRIPFRQNWNSNWIFSNKHSSSPLPAYFNWVETIHAPTANFSRIAAAQMSNRRKWAAIFFSHNIVSLTRAVRSCALLWCNFFFCSDIAHTTHTTHSHMPTSAIGKYGIM